MTNLSYHTNIAVDKRVEKILNRFSKAERSRVARVVFFFRDKGFALTENHLKKLTKTIWELWAGNVRLLFGIVRGQVVIVNVFKKQTQQTPLFEISLAEKRLAEHL